VNGWTWSLRKRPDVRSSRSPGTPIATISCPPIRLPTTEWLTRC